MINEGNQQSAAKVIGSINKDFKIVGSHRVHSWYAWAIVGIVFGMALGIVYVANRSGQATSIEAAQKKSNLAVIGVVEKYLPIVSSRTNPNIWIGTGPISYTTTTYLQAPTETATGVKISKFFKPGKSALGAIGIVGTKIYYASLASNGDYVIDATKAPAADMSKEVIYSFNGIYQQDDGNSKTKLKNIPVAVNLDLRCSAVIPGTRCSDAQTIFSNYRGKDAASVSQNPLAAPAGIAFYATKVNFMMPNDKTRVVNKTLILPAGGGTHTLVFRKNPKTGKFFVHKFIVGPSDTGPEIELPENPDDGEPTDPGNNTTSTPPVVVTPGGSVTVGISSNTNPRKTVLMGSTGNELAKFKITNSSSTKAGITDIIITDNITNNSAGGSSFSSLSIYDGATKIAGPIAPMIKNNTTTVASLSLPLTLGINSFGIKELTLKGDVNTRSSGEAVSGSEHTFCVQDNAHVVGPVEVYGAPSCGNAATVYKSTLSVSGTTIGLQNNRTRVMNDDIGYLDFVADKTYPVKIQTVKIALSGSALAGASSFTADLINKNIGYFGSASQQTCIPNASNSCSVTFSPDYTISAGSSLRIYLRINSSSLTNATGTQDSLSASIVGTGDLLWSDGTTSNISLDPNMAPVTISTVAYE